MTSLPATARCRRTITVSEIATRVNGVLDGDGAVVVDGINGIDEAGPREITFVLNRRFAKRWARSRAAALLVSEDVPADDVRGPRPVIRVADAELASAAALELFTPPPEPPDVGVHPTAWVHPEADVAATARIGPQVSIDRGVRIGEDVVLYAGVVLYADVEIGAGSVLHAGVVVRERCVIGGGCVLAPNVSIGADGFGYRPDPATGGFVRMPHAGSVELGDRVEVGANSCIDRGKFGATRIGDDTKIDNLVQIGHNGIIGKACLIAGSTAIAGSVVLGDRVIVGGGVGITDHVQIGDDARLGARTGLLEDVPAGETWWGFPASPLRHALRQAAAVRKLPELMTRLKDRVGTADPPETSRSASD